MGQSPWVRCRVVYGHEENQKKKGIEKKSEFGGIKKRSTEQ